MRDRRETSHFAKELPPTPEGASHFAKELRGTGRGTDPTSLYDEQLRGAGPTSPRSFEGQAALAG